MNRTAIVSVIAAVGVSAALCFGFVQDHDQSTSATTTPTTRPIADLLLGTYVGTVVDDDETVPCTTRFETYRGKVTGQYIVREGKAAYRGTLTDFVLVDADKPVCRFRWHDKHGTGFLTVQVTADGRSFAGSWGKEVVQDELIWTGERLEPTTRRASGSSEDRRGETKPK